MIAPVPPPLSEWRPTALYGRVDRPQRQVEVARLQRGLLQESFEAVQILLRFAREQDLVGHRAFGVRFFFRAPIRV